MSRIHVAVGLAGALAVVFGAAWAAWPVAETSSDAGPLIAFPYMLPGAGVALVGLVVAIWAMNKIRKERAERLAPPPGWR